jgi:type IV secretion system protein VirD4
MLDELPALGKIRILEKAIAYIAGYGGKMYLIVQDVMQLDAEYGKENALMGNCHVRIGVAPNKPEAAKFLSEMTGKTTVVETKTSLSGARSGHLKNASVSVQEVARPLLTPDECACLPAAVKDSKGNIIEPGDMLIFLAGNRPIYGKQILYFKDPVFSARAKIPAPAVSDKLHEQKVTPAQPDKGKNEKNGKKAVRYETYFNNDVTRDQAAK